MYYSQAEKWLRDQAQELGWAKATKLEGRITAQGLIGVVINKNAAAMVEVNCETDFVARNDTFKDLVRSASEACLKYVQDLPESDLLSRTEFQAESLKNLIAPSGKKLSDELALTIGSLGENASFKRAVCFKVPESVQLTGLAYPTPENTLADSDNSVHFGMHGAILGLKSPQELPQELKKNICLQIVGMKATKIGNKELDKPNADKDEEQCLIYQEFIFDPTCSVGDVLEQNQIDIVDYQRFQCGEEATPEETVDAAKAAN